MESMTASMKVMSSSVVGTHKAIICANIHIRYLSVAPFCYLLLLIRLLISCFPVLDLPKQDCNTSFLTSHNSLYCDGINDCENGQDEQGCTESKFVFAYGNTTLNTILRLHWAGAKCKMAQVPSVTHEVCIYIYAIKPYLGEGEMFPLALYNMTAAPKRCYWKHRHVNLPIPAQPRIVLMSYISFI